MLMSDTAKSESEHLELRATVLRAEPWSFWSPPGTEGQVTRRLFTRRFDAPRSNHIGPASYEDRVRAALTSIDAGEVEKVVVAREEILPAADVAATLEELRWRYPSCWVFAVNDGVDTFLGATPELLARVRHQTLETCALAGTSAPGDEAGLRTEKNLREHRHVIDAICDNLAPLVTRIDVAEHPRTMRLANVQHLRTPITAELRPGVDAEEVVDALHPTPAVCGTPRTAARELIAELEPFDRGLYTGVVGYSNEHEAEFVVAIRSALCTPAATHVYAGAGIVAGSIPADEDAETLAKLRAVSDALRTR